MKAILLIGKSSRKGDSQEIRENSGTERSIGGGGD